MSTCHPNAELEAERDWLSQANMSVRQARNVLQRERDILRPRMRQEMLHSTSSRDWRSPLRQFGLFAKRLRGMAGLRACAC